MHSRSLRFEHPDITTLIIICIYMKGAVMKTSRAFQCYVYFDYAYAMISRCISESETLTPAETAPA
jgi:hypothetical protein